MFHSNADSLQTADIIVNPGDQKQFIDGFGAADAFLDDTALTDTQADMFFDQSLGIGLSIYRTGIDSTGTTMGFFSNAAKASLRGAKVIAVPWSAPAIMKSNLDVNNGGHLNTIAYGTWSDTLAAFQGLLQSNASCDLYAVSVQNEPDFTATYPSMLYTTAEMVNFIKVLGPKLAALTPPVKLMMPEPADWNNTDSYVQAVAADATAQSYLNIIGSHQYSGVVAPTTIFRPVWQTEFSYFDTFDATITKGLTTANDIHTALTTGGVSAWLWWWIINTSNADNEGLVGNAGDSFGSPTITKRLYTLGNFSKFVRPGYYRVGTSGSISNVNITAFKNSTTKDFAVVAINNNASPQTFKLSFNGLNPISITPWVTSSSLNLIAQTPVTISGSGGLFNITLPATSVTTLVGTGI